MMPVVRDVVSSPVLVVGVADFAVGRRADGWLTTFALGSCVGVTIYDPVLRLGGLLHFMLAQPEGPGDEPLRPGMYASLGLPALLARLSEFGLQSSRAIVCVAGGAEVLQHTSNFAIGRRNLQAVHRLLHAEGLPIAAEDTGGNQARTMKLDLADGTVRVRTKGGERILLPACVRDRHPVRSGAGN